MFPTALFVGPPGLENKFGEELVCCCLLMPAIVFVSCPAGGFNRSIEVAPDRCSSPPFDAFADPVAPKLFVALASPDSPRLFPVPAGPSLGESAAPATKTAIARKQQQQFTTTIHNAQPAAQAPVFIGQRHVGLGTDHSAGDARCAA